jgi:hypothetical protein
VHDEPLAGIPLAGHGETTIGRAERELRASAEFSPNEIL